MLQSQFISNDEISSNIRLSAENTKKKQFLIENSIFPLKHEV
jgi:hypothetical protein